MQAYASTCAWLMQVEQLQNGHLQDTDSAYKAVKERV